MSGVDPVLLWLARLGLALLFCAAALHKARDLPAFSESLRDYQILPGPLSNAGARALMAAELAGAAALLLPSADPVGALSTLALLGLYSAAIALNLARGRRHVDCGCLGPAQRQPLAPWLLVRNATLSLGALLLLLPAGAPRTVHWIDGISLLGGIALLVLLWNAAHQLGAVHAAPVAPGRST